jgi:hypothetical protein
LKLCRSLALGRNQIKSQWRIIKNVFMILLKRRKGKMMIFASKVICCLWEKYLEIYYLIEFFKDYFGLFCYWCHCQIHIIFLLFFSHNFLWEPDLKKSLSGISMLFFIISVILIYFLSEITLHSSFDYQNLYIFLLLHFYYKIQRNLHW